MCDVTPGSSTIRDESAYATDGMRPARSHIRILLQTRPSVKQVVSGITPTAGHAVILNSSVAACDCQYRAAGAIPAAASGEGKQFTQSAVKVSCSVISSAPLERVTAQRLGERGAMTAEELRVGYGLEAAGVTKLFRAAGRGRCSRAPSYNSRRAHATEPSAIMRHDRERWLL